MNPPLLTRIEFNMLNAIWIWIDSNNCRRMIAVKRVASNYTSVKYTFFGNHGSNAYKREAVVLYCRGCLCRKHKQLKLRK